MINVMTFIIYGAFGGVHSGLHDRVADGFRIQRRRGRQHFPPITIISLALSGSSGRLAARIGPGSQVVVGPALCGVAALMALGVDADVGYWSVMIPLECVFGLGIAAMVAAVDRGPSPLCR